MARTLDSASLKAFMAAAGKPLPTAGAPWDVDTLALAAAFFSPELTLAQAHWRAALAHQALATATQRPLLDTALEHHSLLDGARSSPWTIGVGLEILLPDPERLAARRGMAESALELARIDLAEALWTVRRRVSQACLEVQARDAEAALALRRLGVQQARLERMQQLASAGLLGRGDVGAARLAAAAAAASSRVADQQLAQARARLRVALALPPGIEPAIRIDTPVLSALPALAQESVSRLGGVALQERPDFAAADWRFRSADAALRYEVAQQYPELSLKPGYEWDQGDHRLRIGMAFPLPLPGAREVPVRAAQADREARAAEVLALQEQILQEVALAHQRVQAAWQQVRSERALALDQDMQRTQLEVAIRLGDRDQLDALDQDLLAIEQAARTTQAERELARCLDQLEDVLHRPIREHAE